LVGELSQVKRVAVAESTQSRLQDRGRHPSGRRRHR
jgi:hypothetical protein